MVIVGLLFLVPRAYAIHLSWGPVTGADHYVVYYGSGPGDYTRQTGEIQGTEVDIDVGHDETFFSVKAFNACGDSSGFSVEVGYDPTLSAPVGLAAYGNIADGSLRVSVVRMDHGVWVPVYMTMDVPVTAPIMGNIKSKIYHVPACRYYKSATVSFGRVSDAMADGYRACEICGDGQGIKAP